MAVPQIPKSKTPKIHKKPFASISLRDLPISAQEYTRLVDTKGRGAAIAEIIRKSLELHSPDKPLLRPEIAKLIRNATHARIPALEFGPNSDIYLYKLETNASKVNVSRVFPTIAHRINHATKTVFNFG